MSRSTGRAVATVAAAVLATPGMGQQGARAGGIATLDAVAACAQIIADAERLACFDRAARSLAAARAAKDIVVLDRDEVRRTKRSLFGFSLPSIRVFGGDEVNEVVGLVADVRTLPGGLLRFAVADNGVWETTEQAVRGPRDGDEVTIRAGSLGSYVATVPRRRAVRVRRLR